MYTLILALMYTSGPPMACFDVQAPAEIAFLTKADAAKLAGKWVRLRVELVSLGEARDGFVVFACASSDATPRTVWFESGVIGGDDADVRPGGERGTLEVVGRLTVVERPSDGDSRVAAELRLLDARPARR